jgi:hypothetical protein
MDSSLREIPYWDFLTNDDKDVYRRINVALAAPTSRNKRNKRVDDFREILDAIELFEDSDVDDRWKRCLVCGICKLPNGIAVNTTQLKKLVFKCKSSINGSLKRLGWDTIVSKPNAYEELLNQIPYLRDHPTEVRQWTIRVGSGCAISEVLADISPPLVEVPPQSFELCVGQQKGPSGWNQEALSGGEQFDEFPDLTFDF